MRPRREDARPLCGAAAEAPRRDDDTGGKARNVEATGAPHAPFIRRDGGRRAWKTTKNMLGAHGAATAYPYSPP